MSTDQQLLDKFFGSATTTIEELVTRALREGHPVWQLAIVLERKFDGAVAGGCGARGAIASRLACDSRLATESRDAIVNAIVGVGLQEIPVVLLVHVEGVVIGGIRRVQGSLAAMS